MKRIIVIGSCGAGKSTFSKKLHAITDLELIHLDRHYWKPHWTETPKAEWESTVKALIAKDSWIIDGNYGGTMDIRIERADTIIFLAYSRLTCMYRVLSRVIKNYGRTRDDLGKDCPEKVDWQFLHYVWNFKKTREPGILNKLEKVKPTKKVYIFENDGQSLNFINELRSSRESAAQLNKDK
ncbi:MAG: DNA topology modulation protein [Bacteroidota bacterium]